MGLGWSNQGLHLDSSAGHCLWRGATLQVQPWHCWPSASAPAWNSHLQSRRSQQKTSFPSNQEQHSGLLRKADRSQGLSSILLLFTVFSEESPPLMTADFNISLEIQLAALGCLQA